MPELLEKPVAKKIAEASATLPTVAVVGLGYVGLPVAVAFGRQRRTIGFDLSRKRVEALRNALDATGIEVGEDEDDAPGCRHAGSAGMPWLDTSESKL